MDEFTIIADIFAPLASPFGFSLKDDAAAIPPRPGEDLVITTDAVIEGVDFFAFDPAGSVAQKSLRVNLSDLAAKGAVPAWCLLSIMLPQSMTMEWLESFAVGLADDFRTYGLSLLGGDTSRTEGPLSITMTAFGHVPHLKMVPRSGAKAGDAIYVTGTIGDSAGGLAIFKRERHTLTEKLRDDLIARYRVPEPPVDFGARHLRNFATASIDVSDGLIADLGHVTAASGIAMEIDAEAIPRSEALRAFWGDGPEAIVRAATAGDDYQIAFTTGSGREDDIRAAAAQAGISVTRIGTVKGGEGVILRYRGQALSVPKPGYRHF
jgi:thiamine-monophosphate kinase